MQMQVCTCSSDCFTKFHVVVSVVVIFVVGGGALKLISKALKKDNNCFAEKQSIIERDSSKRNQL